MIRRITRYIGIRSREKEMCVRTIFPAVCFLASDYISFQSSRWRLICAVTRESIPKPFFTNMLLVLYETLDVTRLDVCGVDDIGKICN